VKRFLVLCVVIALLLLPTVVAAQSYPPALAGRALVADPFPAKMTAQAFHRTPFGWICDELQGEDLVACMGDSAHCRLEVIGEGDHILVRLVDCDWRGWRGWKTIDWWPNVEAYAIDLGGDPPHTQCLEVWTVLTELIVRRQVCLEWDGHVPTTYEFDPYGSEYVWHITPVLPKDQAQAQARPTELGPGDLD
jgi:hypothetical protein